MSSSFSLKAVLRRLLLRAFPVLRSLASAFFSPKYLRGRYFEEHVSGWKWVWRSVWTQKVLGFSRDVPWPVSPFIAISDPRNITFDPDDLNNFQTFGCYFQNFDAHIDIGKGTWIAPNVGVITANHDVNDPSRHLPGQNVVIGRECWIGMNAVILPGVTLGDHTVVGAGAVVTKSFPNGYCVIGGVPARLIRQIDCVNSGGKYR